MVSHPISALLLCGTALLGDGLEDFKASLRGAQARPSVPATLRVRYSEERGEGKQKAQAEAAFQVAALEQGGTLQLKWREADLEAVQQEAARKDQAMGVLTPLRDAMADLDAGRTAHLLRQGEVLSAWIQRCTFVHEEPGAWAGKPARILVFSYAPRVPSHLAHRLKESSGLLKVWIDPSGFPLHSLMEQSYAGRPGRIAPLHKYSAKEETDYQRVQGSVRVLHRDRMIEESDYDAFRGIRLIVDISNSEAR